MKQFVYFICSGIADVMTLLCCTNEVIILKVRLATSNIRVPSKGLQN
jgi:hypothetical protein